MMESAGSRGGAAARERRFYTRMAWFLVALVFIGFAPSFYLKVLGLSYPRPNPPLIPNLMLHGLVFTTWAAIFVTQVSLVAAGRRDLHRALGVVGICIALAGRRKLIFKEKMVDALVKRPGFSGGGFI